MLLSFEDTCNAISSGKLLNIAGTEELLKKLPKGNWIGGSTEHFMAEDGGITTNQMLFVTEFSYDEFRIKSYDEETISNISIDAFDNGFSIVIVPFDSKVHALYAANAPEFEGMFIKNILGWVSGNNVKATDQTPMTLNGITGEAFTNEAVVAHICVPDGKEVSLNIVNIFKQDEATPTIEFLEEGFSATKCLVDGKEVVLANYIAENNINTTLPIIGDYSGVDINTSFKSIENGVVTFYAPVFSGIKYKIAENITSYVDEFNRQLENLADVKAEFSCNCILNFQYGELEGKKMNSFFGPITFGEIAYQLVNQTLVYVTVTDC